MSKRRRRTSRRGARRRQSPADLEKYFRRADNLINHGRAQDAVEFLEPLLDEYPQAANLHYYLGYAYTKAGQLWQGLQGYEEAMRLSRDPGLWLPLASLYLELGQKAHALQAFRQAIKHESEAPTVGDVPGMVSVLERDVQRMADEIGLSFSRMEKGLRFMEEGQRALQQGDYPASIRANRRASRFLKDWPPPHNNLSLTLFFDGQPREAVEMARRVLERHPENVQALSNAIRYLAWTGREEEAQALWTELREIEPQGEDARLKAAEAAAVMQDDESVYELLKPVKKARDVRPDIPGLDRRVQLFLAVAEANLGKQRAARRRLRRLLPNRPELQSWLDDLKEGYPGPGWAVRFPYFSSTELLPAARLEEFVELVDREDEISPRRFERAVTDFVERFPQIVRMAEKLIWEEMQVDAGIAILATVGTPAAHAALRRFGLSQAGDYEARSRALFALLEAGEIAQGERVRVWREGKWQEVQLRRQLITEEAESEYAPQVAELMNSGVAALQAGDLGRGEQLLRRAIELEPRAKEAYNNLGTVYARRGEHEQAKEMFRAALDVDPLYAHPRCNLAAYLLDDDDVDAAIEILKPLADATRFHPRDMAFYAYTQARIFIAQDDFKAAEDSLALALEMWPDYELAQDLLDRLHRTSLFRKAYDSWREQTRERDEAWRARLQEKLSSPEPTLAQTLPLYTKDMLTGMGHKILPGGGWSALRKAELLDEIVKGLTDAENLARMVGELSREERDALRQVLDQGGEMPWETFDAEYDNDLEESRYWNYHVPQTTMGRLRLHGFLAEAVVDDELLVTVPRELRPLLEKALA